MEEDSMPTQVANEDQLSIEQPAPAFIEQGNEDVGSSGDVVVQVVQEEKDREKQSLASGETDGADNGAQIPGQQQQPQQQQSPGQDPESAIKYLVPNYLAGSLIGKKGATIKDIQVKTSCMVRIATSGMYFPGTMERAVLIAGNTDGVKRACALILHTIHAPDHNISGCAKLLSPELAANVDVSQRMLIPLTAGGLVIGRKGANIAALLEASGAKMTLGQKAEIKANERLVTVQGKLPQAVKAVEMLLEKLREEPVLSRFSNLSVSYRGHGSSTSKAASAAGIAPTAEPYQRGARDSSTVTSSPTPEESASSVLSGVSVAAGVTDVDASTAAATGDCGSSAGSPAKSVSSKAESPPRLTSPARAVRGGGYAGQMAGRGMGAGTGGRFLQHQQHQHQQPFRQPMRQPMQHQHHQVVHQHHHRMRQQAHQFHQQPHQQHQHFAISPSRGPPVPHQPHSPPQQQQQQQQPPQHQHQPPMMQMTPAGPMVAAPPDHQMGVMTPLGTIVSNPPAMHRMGMAYGPPPAAGAYFSGGMQAPGVAAAVATGMVARGPDGQQAPRGGYAAPTPMSPPPGPPLQAQPQQHQQQVLMTMEAPVTNPIAAAVASCPPTTSVTVGVPNNMIGAILGRGGATIAELQSMSGARINVSQRDELLPGTDSRLLTISGTPMATQAAQYLVSQKIQEIADRRRDGQSP